MIKRSDIAVFISTYNREQLLVDCLESLIVAFNYSEMSLDVLVVDNNSIGDIQNVVLTLGWEDSDFRVVRETKQGVGNARNRALFELGGSYEWMVGLDDDAIVPEDWVTKLVEIVNSGAWDCFGGIYEPWYRDGKKWWHQPRFGTNRYSLKYSDPHLLAEGEYVCSGVWAFKTSFALETGGFDTSVGMIGDKIGYSGENIFQYKLRQLGARIGFEPDWKILHHVPLRKQKIGWFVKSGYASGLSYNNIKRKKSAWGVFPLSLFRVLAGWLHDVYRLEKNFRREDHYWICLYLTMVRRAGFRWGQFVSTFGEKHDA